jgi:hypothetical protein
MNRNPGTIGLSDEQSRQLMQLRNDYQSRIGYNLADPAIWFGNHVSNYLVALCLDAAIDNHKLKTRRSTQLRRDSILAFESYLERTPVADDLIEELGRFVTVPEFAAEAIRRDVQHLST